MGGEPAAGVPRAALLLGWLGVTPFVGLTVAVTFGGPQVDGPALRYLVLYGAVILSFMGGVQWGLAIGPPGGRANLARPLAISVLPAVGAWASLVLLPASATAGVLAAAFTLLLAYDLATVRQGLGPAWYGSLRAPLTAVVVSCLLISTAARAL